MSPLPNFTGNPQSAKDILDYLTDPTNNEFASINAAVAALTVIVNAKIDHYIQEAPPASAELGSFWTQESIKQTSYCNAAYDIGEPAPSVRWTATTDTSSIAMLQVMAQITSPTPQIGLLTQTITGMSSDLNITSAEKATVKILYDEMTQKRVEIDLNSVRYNLTNDVEYTDYVASHDALIAYMTSTGVLTNLNVDTTIASSTDWNNNWTAALADEGTMIALLRTTNLNLLATIDTNSSSALAQLDEMTADGKISKQEKLTFRTEWTRIQSEYAALSAQATEYAQTGAASFVALAATYASLTTYLGTTTSVFTDMSTSLDLSDVGSNATEWQAKWQAYYIDSKVFDTYIDTYFNGLLSAQDATLQGFITDLQAIASDGIISGGTEKQEAKRLWQDITRLHSKILYQGAQYSVATPAAYTLAYDALSVYLNTTLDLFTDLTTDTPVTRAVYNSKFDDFYFQYDTFTDLVSDAQKNAVDGDPADYEDYKALIDSVVDDGIVSAGMEKTRFNAVWLDIQASQAIIVASGNNAGASTVGLVAAYDDLATYLGTLTAPAGSTPNFTIENEDTAIGVSTFYSKMRAYETSKSTLESDIINQLIELQAGNARTILDMNDDGIISVSEKGTLYKDWLSETAEKAQLDAQADLLSITTEKTNMDSAYTTLETYLDSLESGTGLFTDLTTATTLTTPQKDAWDGHWNLYYSTKATLETTIIATVQGNTSAVATAAFQKNGSVAATGDFDMADNGINNILAKTLQAASKWAATNGQLYTEQQARLAHEGLDDAHLPAGVSGKVVGTAGNQVLTGKSISADANPITELEANNLKAGVVETDVLASTTADDSTWPSTKATKTAIESHSGETDDVHGIGASADVVGTDTAQTLTNKTINGSQLVDGSIPQAKIDPADILTIMQGSTKLINAQAIKTYVDNLDLGGGGGGGAVDLEWVQVGGVETTNTGTGVSLMSGTLVLPAGKKWKRIELVILGRLTSSNGMEPTIIKEGVLDVTSNFVHNFGAVGTGNNDDSLAPTYLASGVPTVTDSDITYSVEGNTSLTVNRAYIVGIAAGDPQASEEYGVYDTGSTTAPSAVGVLGTRIDLTDSDYSSSSFTFTLEHIWASGGAHGLTAIIKKISGGEPYCIFRSTGDNKNQYSGNGALASDNATVIDSFSKYTIKRLNISNELCFEVSTTDTGTYDYTNYMTGPKSYTGTAITSTNGTTF